MPKLMVQSLTVLAIVAPPLCALAQAAEAQPYVASLFTDNMVLQRGVPAPVWGWTTPGATVTVSVAGKTAKAVASADGKWLAKLPPLPVGGPYTLSVAGPQNVALQNVLVGDVWICSGQSNMEMGVALAKDSEAEIASANYPTIRLFTVPKVPSLNALTSVDGKWEPCSPATLSNGGWGGFTAAGYYFGRTLSQELKVPIGLIHSSWGGTVAEAWVSSEALKTKMPDFRRKAIQVEAAAASTRRGSYDADVKAWFPKNDPGSREGANWQSPSFDDSSWKLMPLPGPWELSVLPDFDGVVWLRKEVNLETAGPATLHLGMIDDADVTWVNGVKVGETDDWAADRVYRVPEGILKAGRNVITVRVLDTQLAGGMTNNTLKLSLDVDGQESIPLKGDWKYYPSVDLSKSDPFPAKFANDPNVPTVLYNGMIAPLLPFAIKGAIWYQGESNVGRDEQYSRLLPTLINDWRARFGVGPFPFYIVQLANYMARSNEPSDDLWPLLREAQYITTKRVKNAGIATAIDIGDEVDIHPKNKQEVGRRLALNALALTYGKKIEYSGPIYAGCKVEGNAIRLNFTHTTGGLVAKGDKNVQGFAIAGADGKYVWADAKIVGNSVVVSSPRIAAPRTVRYAWSNNPVANLYNRAGLPTLPFRTDGPTK